MIIFPLLNHAEVSVMAGCFIGKRKDYKKNSLKLNLRQKKKNLSKLSRQNESQTKTVFSPCERELLESTSFLLLLLHLR